MGRLHRKSDRYSVKRTYVVICRDCNEDISRPITGADLYTRAEADEAVAEHDEAFHPEDRRA